MRYQGAGSDSVRNVLVQLLAELQPEIHARKVHVELDLDEVAIQPAGPFPAQPASTRRPQIIAAIRGLLADAIESAAYDGDLSVTLIDTDNAWELELAVSAQPQPPGWTRDSEDAADTGPLDCLVPGLRGKNFSISNRVANECGGQVQFLECPQGGSARVLVMPKHPPGRAA